MNNKRDCFNNRSKNQPVFLSRADRAATWRGRGINNRLSFKADRNSNGSQNAFTTNMDYKLEAESEWNNIPNPTHSQQNIVSLVDNNLELQVNPNYSIRTQTRAPPGITPLYNIPSVPLSSNKWSNTFKYDCYNTLPSTPRLQPQLPERRMVLGIVDENYQFPPGQGYNDTANKYLLRKEYEYKLAQRQQNNWMPLQSVENNRSLNMQQQEQYIKQPSDNGMYSNNSCQPQQQPQRRCSQESTWNNKENQTINPIGSQSSRSTTTITSSKNSNKSVTTPRSWSQVVLSGPNRSSVPLNSVKVEPTASPQDYKASHNVLASPPHSVADCNPEVYFSSSLHTKSLKTNYGSSHNSTFNASSDIHPGQVIRYISDSFSFMLSPLARFSDSPEERPFTVLRISNIPWSISSDDIAALINRNRHIAIPSYIELPQSIHIIMDPQTGKTCGEAFVEVEMVHDKDINYVIGQLSTYPVQGRHLRFTLSTYDELRRRLFPAWTAQSRLSITAGPYEEGDGTQLNEGNNAGIMFIGQKELQGLLNVCRNYKVFYNRKCPERSFEYLISITLNIPWLQKKCVTTIQRDILYECYKLVAEALRIHISKTLHSFDSRLMTRLIRTALTCDGFTIKQKQVILNNSKMECPKDLVESLIDNRETPPPEQIAMDSVLQSIIN